MSHAERGSAGGVAKSSELVAARCNDRNAVKNNKLREAICMKKDEATCVDPAIETCVT